MRSLFLFSALLCLAALRAQAQFETSSAFTLPTAPGYLAAGDFNGDGNLDVAISGYLPIHEVIILLGNGDGTFRMGSTYSVGVQIEQIVAADLRGNGILDLVVGESLSQNLYVLLGNGDGTFQSPVSYPTSGEPYLVNVADFNNDGKLDIIAVTSPAGECACIEVLTGLGDGTFGPPIISPIPYGQNAEGSPQTVALNGTGD